MTNDSRIIAIQVPLCSQVTVCQKPSLPYTKSVLCSFYTATLWQMSQIKHTKNNSTHQLDKNRTKSITTKQMNNPAQSWNYYESYTWTSLKLRLTTRLNKNARPVAPVKRVDINSARFVSGVSQLAHRKILEPPRWLKNMRPMFSQSMYVSVQTETVSNISTTARITRWLEELKITPYLEIDTAKFKHCKILKEQTTGSILNFTVTLTHKTLIITHNWDSLRWRTPKREKWPL